MEDAAETEAETPAERFITADWRNEAFVFQNNSNEYFTNTTKTQGAKTN